MTVRFAGLCLRAGGACLTLALCWPPILARAEAPSVLIPFAIPAQPLSQALVAYSRASGMTVLVDSGLTEVGRRPPWTADIRREMRCAGCWPGRPVDPLCQRVLVHPGGGPAAGASSAATPARHRPCRPLAGRVAPRPVRGGRHAPGGYRALVQLWFDGDARVSKMNWITRSGLAARDQALEHALADMRAGPLPVDLPQPVTVLLEPRAARQCDMLEGASGG